MTYFRHRVEALLSSGFPIRDSYRGLFAPVALIGLIHIIGGTAVLFAPQAAYVSQLSGPMMLLSEPIAIAIGLIVLLASKSSLRDDIARRNPDYDAHKVDTFGGKRWNDGEQKCADRPENRQPHRLPIDDHCAEKKKAATSPRPPSRKSKC